MPCPATAANIAHAIEHLLRSTCVKPSWRVRILDYVRAGYDGNGDRIDRSEDLDQHMKLLECEECGLIECRDDCPNKGYHDLLRVGDVTPILTD